MKKDEVKDKTKKQNDKKNKKVSHKINSSSQIGKKQSRMLSEILTPLFGCHQQFLLDDLRGGFPRLAQSPEIYAYSIDILHIYV